ncbi:MAG: prohibitin family protein [Saprospiraceae bacterium]|nr:prohibitin family protein [Saprospiraceae bacterium]|tara:strand:+ start:6285 stop:7136 length:852 start_codon:yes stop_codon:yes gene_type:complete
MTNFNPKNPIPINQGKIMRYVTIGVIGIMVFSLLTNTTFITIDPGHKGVKFKRFQGGLDKTHIYDQGFKVVMPWDDMILYDVRIQEANEAMDVLSKNGLSINIDLSYRFKVQSDKIGDLHDEIGKGYLDRIIKPEIRSATRQVIGEYLPEELYSTKREAIQDEIEAMTKAACADKFIDIDAILIRSVQLPEKIKQAIELKLDEEQQSLQYEFRLEKERKEAERKIIEAQAKADANKILNASLTDKILQDKGIEATLDLAQSPNTKIVIVGGGDKGLPLILGNN